MHQSKKKNVKMRIFDNKSLTINNARKELIENYCLR
jgi:hypothetical protein